MNTAKIGQAAAALLLALAATIPVTDAKADVSPCISEEDTFFRCTVKGKPVAFCSNFATDAPSVRFMQGKMDKNGQVEYQFDVYAGDKNRFNIAQHALGQSMLTTVFFRDKGTTYAVTACDGMECNPDRATWVTILKGKSKAGGGFCDVNSSSGFRFPITEDKKGNLVIKMKEYFAPAKKPLEAFATTNNSWAE